MIPKIIHYCWFGGKPLTWDAKRCIESWKRFAPDYQIIEWNENNFEIDNSIPFVKKAYAEKAWAFVSDYVRLQVVYDNGGIYLDIDVELIRNIDFLLENSFYIGVQQDGKFCTTGLGFGAEKGNSIVKKMMDQYYELNFNINNVQNFACPILNNLVIEKMGYSYTNSIWTFNRVTVYPCSFFDPIAPGKTKDLTCNDTVSIHHYAASWLNKKNSYKRKIFIFIGVKNVSKIKKFIDRIASIKNGKNYEI